MGSSSDCLSSQASLFGSRSGLHEAVLVLVFRLTPNLRRTTPGARVREARGSGCGVQPTLTTGKNLSRVEVVGIVRKLVATQIALHIQLLPVKNRSDLEIDAAIASEYVEPASVIGFLGADTGEPDPWRQIAQRAFKGLKFLFEQFLSLETFDFHKMHRYGSFSQII